MARKERSVFEPPHPRQSRPDEGHPPRSATKPISADEIEAPQRRKLSIEEPVSLLRHIKIEECGEELVELMDHPRLFLDRPRFNYRRETVVRKSVCEFLWRAADALPKGFKLAIVEGWRPPHIQRRMYAAIYRRYKKMYPNWSQPRLKRLVNQFTAPMNAKVPPPHTTGGAIDLVLAREDGSICDHTSPYKITDHRCFPLDAAGLSDEARQTREMLRTIFATGDLTNYPSEYWHWSYGDQGWAYRGRHDRALYGATAPPNWTPDPRDDVDEPLTFLLDLEEQGEGIF